MSNPPPQRKQILLLRLPSSATSATKTLNASAATLQAQVAASIAQANSAGFDIVGFELDESSLGGLLAEKLRSQHWDGFLFGYAIRGNRELTPVFEAAVNVLGQVKPGVRVLFGNAPDDLMVTLGRNF